MGLKLIAQVSQRLLLDIVPEDLVAEPHGEASYPGVLGKHPNHELAFELSPVASQYREEHFLFFPEMHAGSLFART